RFPPRLRVLLPDPLGPHTTRTSPRATSRSTSLRTWSLPNHLFTCSKRMIGLPADIGLLASRRPHAGSARTRPDSPRGLSPERAPGGSTAAASDEVSLLRSIAGRPGAHKRRRRDDFRPKVRLERNQRASIETGSGSLARLPS